MKFEFDTLEELNTFFEWVQKQRGTAKEPEPEPAINKPNKTKLIEPLSAIREPFGRNGFPQVWATRTKDCIDKFKAFRFADIAGDSARVNNKSRANYMQWATYEIKKGRLDLEKTRDPSRFGNPTLFIPFRWENGVKVLATQTVPEQFYYTKTATGVRKVAPEYLPEDEIATDYEFIAHAL